MNGEEHFAALRVRRDDAEGVREEEAGAGDGDAIIVASVSGMRDGRGGVRLHRKAEPSGLRIFIELSVGDAGTKPKGTADAPDIVER